MLTAFIHLLPLAYFYICYMTKRTTTLPWPFERILWTDLTCWHWVIGGVVSTLILAQLFLVLAAVIRVRRLNSERRKNESPSLLTEPEVGAFQNIGSPTITPPQPDFPSRSQYVLTYFSEDDLEDLPPSYSSLDVLQAGPEYFKT